MARTLVKQTTLTPQVRDKFGRPGFISRLLRPSSEIQDAQRHGDVRVEDVISRSITQLKLDELALLPIDVVNGLQFRVNDTLLASLDIAGNWILNGRVTNPGQPCFMAEAQAAQASVTGDGTTYTAIFEQERYDQRSNYNPVTGIFTADITGKYLFTGWLNVQDLDSAGCTTWWTQLATSNRNYVLEATANAATATLDTISVPVCVVADLDSGDTAKIQVRAAGGTKTVDIGGATGSRAYFSGVLIC